MLALEFMLLYFAHGSDPTPRASKRQLLHAWWGEVLSAPRVFCWLQPFRSTRWPDHLPAHAQGRRGVLLVHGFVCNRGVWNAWLQRLSDAGTPFVAVNLEPVFGSIEHYADLIEAAVQQLERCTGVAPVAVAHSMGGLALRHWWSQPLNDARLQHVITIATPHQGTWLARFALSHNSRQMRQRSEWLLGLSGREVPARVARMTCFYGHCDNIVFPPSTATVPGADNRHLAGTAHVHMVSHPAPWAELLQRLS